MKGLDESSRYNQIHFKSRLDEEGKTMVYSNHNVHHRDPSIWQMYLLILVAHDDTVELFVVQILSRNRMCLECNNYTCSGWINTFIKIKRRNVISVTTADNNYTSYPRLQEFNEIMCNALEIVACPFVLFFFLMLVFVLPFPDSDYPFDVFKLFFICIIALFTILKLYLK